MKIIESTLHIGAQRPFDILHVSDTHLTFADGRDDDNGRKLKLAQDRLPYFPNAEENLEFIGKTAREKGLTIMHTGDLLDFVSEANLDAARKFTAENDVFTAAGNHEFSLYVGEAWEDADYRNRSLRKVQAAFSNDIRFSARVINGINFVALDNSYYLIEDGQLEKLKAEAEKGLPVVLMMHTPLYTPALFDYHFSFRNGGPAYLMAVPEARMDYYTPHRFRQQRADEATLRAYDYIMSESRIKAVLTGHLHLDYDDVLPGDRPQLITDVDTMRIVHID